MAFEDVGRISSVVVALVNKAAPPPTCSLKKAKRKRGQEKRFMFSTDGWTLNYVRKLSVPGIHLTSSSRKALHHK